MGVFIPLPPRSNVANSANRSPAIFESKFVKKKTAKQTLTKDQHRHVIGTSAAGKNFFTQQLIRDITESGKSFSILDPHGDLADSAKMLSKKKSKRRTG